MKYLHILAVLTIAVTPVMAQDAPAKALNPKQQIIGFYSLCKDNKAAEGLQEMLASNPVVKGADVARVAQAFGELVKQMGGFVDFEFSKEITISKRTLVIRCIAHFEKQPFVNEYTFYDPGNDDWRLVHLRYDANLATMFLSDIEGKQTKAK